MRPRLSSKFQDSQKYNPARSHSETAGRGRLHHQYMAWPYYEILFTLQRNKPVILATTYNTEEI